MTIGRLIGLGVASLALAAVPAGIDTRALIVDQTGTAMGTVGNPVNVTGTAGGGSVTQGTTPWVVGGSLTNNNAVPGATNVGVLPALANAAAPTWVEGNQALLSTTLGGALRCVVSGTTVPGSAVPLPVSVGMNGAGAVLKHMTSALGAYPTPGDQALAVGPGVFDGANWQSQRGNTSGVFTQGPAAAGAAIAGNPLLAGGSDGTNARALKTDSSGNLQVGNVAGTAAIGNVGGLTKTISVTLTRAATTTTYTANDEMTDTGGTIRTISNAATVSGGSGIMTHCYLSCSSNGATKPTFTVYVYDTTSTPAADNAVFAPTSAVQDTGVGYFTLSSAEVGDATAGTGNFTMDSGQIHLPYTTSGSANLFFRVKVTNGYTPGANSDTYKFRFMLQQDSN